MAKSNLLDTRTANFLELVGNGRVYQVPAFQRDYSWEEEQWEDLWDDVWVLKDNPDEIHYMGAVVVEAKSDREFLIIDGQQRIATLSLLALAVIQKLQFMAGEDIETDANLERATGLRSRFIGEKDPASLVESSKLSLNQTDDGFYQDYLIRLRRPHNPRGLPKSNRLLWQCLEYFIGKINAISAFREDGAGVASFLAETIGRQLRFILIQVDDELNAYTVFETLNARGLELSSTDLLKNYLFSRLRVASDLEVLKRRWRNLIDTVKQERFPEFLRFHLLCEIPRIRNEGLFKLVRNRVQDGAQVFDLMDALESRAELFAALGDPTHGYWIEYPECKPYVRELKLFRVRQMTPLLFAAWEQLRTDFHRVLKLVAVVSFRYTVIGGLNPNALEPVYHLAARAVLGTDRSRLTGIFAALRDIYVDDEKFKQDFARFSISPNGQRRKLAKYILSKLESDASGRACDPETDPGTIEHILPENPTGSWPNYFPPERWEAFVERLGNLTLLEPALNRRLGSDEYSVKHNGYGQSQYALTLQIHALDLEEWNPALLEDRQQRLADRAVTLWRADVS